MKRRLTEIDLARLISRPRAEQRLHLELLDGGSFPALTYNPTRSVLPDLFNEKGELIDGKEVPWEFIELAIKKKVRKGELEEKQNLLIAKLLHEYALSKKLWSRHHEFYPIKMAFAGGLKFWWDLYFIENGTAVVPFVDPRLNKGLTQEGKRAVFSFMHERIRVAGSDFENCRLAIFQFPKNQDGVRELKITYDDGIELYDFDQLSGMVASLYSEWETMHSEKEAARRGAAGGLGGLFG